jgi:hypothetical protein
MVQWFSPIGQLLAKVPKEETGVREGRRENWIADQNSLLKQPKINYKLSMIMMWAEYAKQKKITLVMDDGRPFILIDSGASNLIFLITERNILEDFQPCDREL